MFSLYVTDELFIDLQRWKSQTSTQFSQPCRPRQFNLDGFPTTCEQLRDEKKQHLEVTAVCAKDRVLQALGIKLSPLEATLFVSLPAPQLVLYLNHTAAGKSKSEAPSIAKLTPAVSQGRSTEIICPAARQVTAQDTKPKPNMGRVKKRKSEIAWGTGLNPVMHSGFCPLQQAMAQAVNTQWKALLHDCLCGYTQVLGSNGSYLPLAHQHLHMLITTSAVISVRPPADEFAVNNWRYTQLTMHKSGSNAASAFMLDPCSFGKKRAMTV
ncbi:hypothetical protein Anapl_04611 [Anas platyrhynchos]|uniref:Uncharacterized protein n=1 Tax=Anas platyrhynchos TaxID=8839 RepID=R0K5K6_ANAPL|nr:hypothetical protein Anapl_04611 [Anas platyrhynchos]